MTCANPASPARRNGAWRHVGRALAAAMAVAALTGCEDKNTFVAPPPPKVDVAAPVQRGHVADGHPQPVDHGLAAADAFEADDWAGHADTGGRPAELFRFRRDVLRERPTPGLRLGVRRNKAS